MQRTIRGVAHISPTYFDGDASVGGGERYPTELAKAMAKLVPTELISFGDRPAMFEHESVTYRIYRAPISLDNNPANPLDLRFLARLLGCGIIHVHQVSTVVSNLACLLGGLPRRLVFVTDHGGGGRDYGRFLPLRHCVRAHLSVSAFAGRHSPLAAQCVQPIYGGVDTSRYQPKAAEREPYALFVGRVLPHKGVDDLIRASSDHMQLVIAGRLPGGGDGRASRYYADLVRLAEGKRVRFVANPSDDELVALYQRATVTVLPSVYDDMYGGHTDVPELLGLVLLESMACGTPVICTRVGGMPEVVREGETGLVVPPNDPPALRTALAALVAEPERAARMGAAGREHVLRHFTWDVVARRCLAAYGAS